MNGYVSTITYGDVESGGMGAAVHFSDDLETALKHVAKEVDEMPEEYEVLNITIANARGSDE